MGQTWSWCHRHDIIRHSVSLSNRVSNNCISRQRILVIFSEFPLFLSFPIFTPSVQSGLRLKIINFDKSFETHLTLKIIVCDSLGFGGLDFKIGVCVS